MKKVKVLILLYLIVALALEQIPDSRPELDTRQIHPHVGSGRVGSGQNIFHLWWIGWGQVGSVAKNVK